MNEDIQLTSKIQADALIDRIQANMNMADAKLRGLSPEETTKAMFKGVDMDVLAKVIKSVNIILAFLKGMGMSEEEAFQSGAFADYASTVQCTKGMDVPVENVRSWFSLMETSETVYDMFVYTLCMLGISQEEYFSRIQGEVNKGWFIKHLKETPIRSFLVVSFTEQKYKVDYDDTMKKHIEQVAKAQKRMEHHKILTRDD